MSVDELSEAMKRALAERRATLVVHPDTLPVFEPSARAAGIKIHVSRSMQPGRLVALLDATDRDGAIAALREAGR